MKEPHGRSQTPSKVCGAKTRAGGKCKKLGMANGRCRNHGGATPVGPANANYKHGRYSASGILPRGLAEHYAKTSQQTDAELLSLTNELALIDARSTQILAEGSGPRTLSKAQMSALWNKLERTFEQRRKMVESEQRRRKEAQETLSIRQGIALVSMVGHIVREYVLDRAVQAKIFSELRKLLKPASPEAPGLPILDVDPLPDADEMSST